jgi:hypothetical protein
VVAYDYKGMFPVILSIANSGSSNVGVGRLAVSTEPLGNQDQHTADDRSPKPSGEHIVG